MTRVEFESAVVQHYEYLVRVARVRTGSPQDARDIVHEVVAGLLRPDDATGLIALEITDVRHVRGFLAFAVECESKNFLKKRSNRERLDAERVEPDIIVDPLMIVAQYVDLGYALGRLDKEDADILRALYVEGRTDREVAANLGWPRIRLQRHCSKLLDRIRTEFLPDYQEGHLA